MLQVEVFKFQFEWAAVAGFQPPIAFRAVVVGHRVVGRSEHASGSREIAPTSYRRKRWDDPDVFLLGKMEFSCLYQTGVTATLFCGRTQLRLQRVASLCQHPLLLRILMTSLRKDIVEPGYFHLFILENKTKAVAINSEIFVMLKFSTESNDKIQLKKKLDESMAVYESRNQSDQILQGKTALSHLPVNDPSQLTENPGPEPRKSLLNCNHSLLLWEMILGGGFEPQYVPRDGELS